MAGISTSSISRMQRGEAVLVTTIVKLINALNRHHFSTVHKPLDPDMELKKEAA